MSLFKQFNQLGVATGIVAVLGVSGCSSNMSNAQITHHWVSQDKVAGNVYRNDVAACSSGEASQRAGSAEFKSYQKCMNERGYSLVAANELGDSGQE